MASGSGAGPMWSDWVFSHTHLYVSVYLILLYVYKYNKTFEGADDFNVCRMPLGLS